MFVCLFFLFFFFKQKTAYEIVSRDWSSDVCSSDLQKTNNIRCAILYSGTPSYTVWFSRVCCCLLLLQSEEFRVITISAGLKQMLECSNMLFQEDPMVSVSKTSDFNSIGNAGHCNTRINSNSFLTNNII